MTHIELDAGQADWLQELLLSIANNDKVPFELVAGIDVDMATTLAQEMLSQFGKG